MISRVTQLLSQHIRTGGQIEGQIALKGNGTAFRIGDKSNDSACVHVAMRDLVGEVVGDKFEGENTISKSVLSHVVHAESPFSPIVAQGKAA
jgi:hypothetical protein